MERNSLVVAQEQLEALRVVDVDDRVLRFREARRARRKQQE
jgi:formyltetrahydrofolate synthetase